MIPRIAATVSRLVKTGASVAARLAEGGASVLGVRSGTAEPRFVVERETAGLQIRRYGPRIAAETTVDADNEAAARNAGFRRLAGYIFGGNERENRDDRAGHSGAQRCPQWSENRHDSAGGAGGRRGRRLGESVLHARRPVDGNASRTQ